MSEATATRNNAKADIAGRIQWGAGYLVKDIQAMPDDMLCKDNGGCSRSAIDVLYEMAVVNRMVATILRGEELGVPPPEGWMRAPKEFCTQAQAIEAIESSTKEMLDAFAKVPEERLPVEMDTPIGRMPLGQLMNIMAGHVMYHSGQLNYIQTLHGDDKFHWMDH